MVDDDRAEDDDRADYHEGPEAARRAEQTLTRVLTVSKEELARREAAYQKSRDRKDRPGPKTTKK